MGELRKELASRLGYPKEAIILLLADAELADNDVLCPASLPEVMLAASFNCDKKTCIPLSKKPKSGRGRLRLAPHNNISYPLFVKNSGEDLSCHPMHGAVLRGEASRVAAMFKESDDSVQEQLLERNKSGNTALHYAAFTGHADAARVLLKAAEMSDLRQEVLSQCNAKGSTAFLVAAFHGHLDMVQLLLEAASTDELQQELLRTVDERGNNALLLASFQGHAAIVRALVRAPSTQSMHRVLLMSQNVYGSLASHLAALNGCLEVMKALIEAACAEGLWIEISSAKDANGNTPRDNAVRLGRTDIVGLLDCHLCIGPPC